MLASFLMASPNPDPPTTTGGAEPPPQFSNTVASMLDPQSGKARAHAAGMGALLLALAQQEKAIREGARQEAFDCPGKAGFAP